MSSVDIGWTALIAIVGFTLPFFLTAQENKESAIRFQTLSQSNIEQAPIVASFIQRSKKRTKQERCLSQMPALLDIMGLGLSAGLSFDASLDLYCSRFNNDLSQALKSAMLRWRCGISSRSDALSNLAEDLDSAPLKRFADAVMESLSFGTPLAAVLERQSRAIRSEQRSQIEERIEKAPVKMLLPLGTLIVPAMLLAILGPLMSSAVGM